MTSARDQLIKSLKDPAYRVVYVDEHIGQEVAFQLRAMRKARGWTQSKVAEESGTVQEVISKLEDPDYGRFSLSTLKRMAATFDVDLIVRFAPFSERVDRLDNLTYSYLAVPAHADDRPMWRSAAMALSDAISSLPTSASATRTQVAEVVGIGTASFDSLARDKTGTQIAQIKAAVVSGVG